MTRFKTLSAVIVTTLTVALSSGHAAHAQDRRWVETAAKNEDGASFAYKSPGMRQHEHAYMHMTLTGPLVRHFVNGAFNGWRFGPEFRNAYTTSRVDWVRNASERCRSIEKDGITTTATPAQRDNCVANRLYSGVKIRFDLALFEDKPGTRIAPLFYNPDSKEKTYLTQKTNVAQRAIEDVKLHTSTCFDRLDYFKTYADTGKYTGNYITCSNKDLIAGHMDFSLPLVDFLKMNGLAQEKRQSVGLHFGADPGQGNNIAYISYHNLYELIVQAMK